MMDAEVRFCPGGAVRAVAGQSLLWVAETHSVELASRCRMGRCGLAPVQILTGEGHLTPPGRTERPTLERLALPAGWRLACSARVLGPVSVAVPEPLPRRRAG
jgi:ferredoxin